VKHKPLERVDNTYLSEINKSNKLNFSFGSSDVVFALTTKGNSYTKNVSNLIKKKMLIVRKDVNLSDLSKTLGFMKRDKLYIFSIYPDGISGNININKVKESSLINYIEIGT
jgi:hypothetical protein